MEDRFRLFLPGCIRSDGTKVGPSWFYFNDDHFITDREGVYHSFADMLSSLRRMCEAVRAFRNNRLGQLIVQSESGMSMPALFFD